MLNNRSIDQRLKHRSSHADGRRCRAASATAGVMQSIPLINRMSGASLGSGSILGSQQSLTTTGRQCSQMVSIRPSRLLDLRQASQAAAGAQQHLRRCHQERQRDDQNALCYAGPDHSCFQELRVPRSLVLPILSSRLEIQQEPN